MRGDEERVQTSSRLGLKPQNVNFDCTHSALKQHSSTNSKGDLQAGKLFIAFNKTAAKIFYAIIKIWRQKTASDGVTRWRLRRPGESLPPTSTLDSVGAALFKRDLSGNYRWRLVIDFRTTPRYSDCGTHGSTYHRLE